MSDLVNPESESEESIPANPENFPETPGSNRQLQGIFEELELHLHRNRSGDGMDISTFSESQKDKIIDLLGKNEDNAFNYHNKRLDALKEIQLAHIQSTTVEQRTDRIKVVLIIIVLTLITFAILFFKSEFFQIWIAFISGLGGGVGLKTMSDKQKGNQNSSPSLPEE